MLAMDGSIAGKLGETVGRGPVAQPEPKLGNAEEIDVINETKLPFGRNPVNVYQWLHHLRNKQIPRGASYISPSPLARLMPVEADKIYKILYHGPDHEFSAKFMRTTFAGETPVFHGRFPSSYGGFYAHLSFTSPCIVYTESWNTYGRLVRQDAVYCVTSEQLEHGTQVAVAEFKQRLEDYHEKHKDDGKKFAHEQIDFIIQLGFTRQQAWNILSKASPSRCAFTAKWAVDMATLGFTRQQMLPVLEEIKAELPKIRFNERYAFVASKIPVMLHAPYQGESVIGVQKVFDGAQLAMLFYELNQKA